MAEGNFFNRDYHVFRKEFNPNRLFASFSIYKSIKGVNVFHYEDRPPYPILNPRPDFYNIVANVNKSDVTLYLTHLGLGN